MALGELEAVVNLIQEQPEYEERMPDDIQQYIDEVQEIDGNCSEVEFPGMFS